MLVNPARSRFAVASHEVVEGRPRTSVLLQYSKKRLVGLQRVLYRAISVVRGHLAVGFHQEGGQAVEYRYHAIETIDEASSQGRVIGGARESGRYV